MKNRHIKQRMVGVARSEVMDISDKLSDNEAVVWYDGPCYICGGNFIWLSEGLVSLTGDELRGSNHEQKVS